jgi:cobyrinic acid a,c-diamide synthase
MAQQQNYSIPRIVISGLRGGGGKTILSLCLVALWRKRGLRVAPFKKGPDYIDAGWLAQAASTPCFNLDLFMMSPEQVKQSFSSHSENANIAIIEGNRGLYDGIDDKGTYSTAELAKLLKAPVLLMVDCTKVTNTAAALVLGCQKIDSDVLIGGVVLNRVATTRQEDVIRKAIHDKCKLPVLGALPRLKKDPFPERHMGLTPYQEHLDIEKSISVIAEAGEKYLDTDGIWHLAKGAEPLKSGLEFEVQSLEKRLYKNSKPQTQNSKLRIGIIKDSAFQFYYQENIEELEKRGAQLIEVNALKETRLPDISALYIGGGFPETHAVDLADNMSFKQSLYEAIEHGLPVYAECGGLMFLGKSLVLQNKTYPMVGSLPVTFSLEKKPQAHGYTIIKVEHANPYFPENIILKGHEFHYSRVLEIKENNTYMAFKVKRGRGIVDNRDGLCYKNVLASYTHLHALGASEWADGLLRCADEFKK